MENKRVAVYCRVSTDEQAEHGFSLSDQERKGRAQAVVKGLEVVRYHDANNGAYVDDGVSGTTPADERPALRQLLQDCRDKKIDAVCFTKLDRLARNAKLLLTLWDEIEEYGCTIFVTDESIDTSTAVGRLTRTLLASLAEFERDTILARTMAGKAEKMRRGEAWCSTAPYGYRYVPRDRATHTPGRYEIDDETAPTVQRIFEMMAGGMSTIKVAETLTREGVPTQKRDKTGHSVWQFGTIRQMVDNPTYVGKAPRGRHRVGPRKDKDDKVIPGKKSRIRVAIEDVTLLDVPAIVTPELAATAQEQMRRNRQQSRRNAKNDYLLGGGIIKCGICNHTMSGTIHGRAQLVYYRCSHTAANGSRVMHDVKGRDIEPAVWGALCDLLHNPDTILNSLEALADEGSDHAQKMDADVARLEREAGAVEQEENRLLDLYLKERIALEVYDTKAAALTARRQALHASITGLADQRDAAIAHTLPTGDVRAMCAQIARGLKKLTFEERQQTVRTYITRLTATREAVEMEGILPVSEGVAIAPNIAALPC